MNFKQRIDEAAERIGPYVRKTPLEPSFALSGQSGAEVALKLECVQHTRSFKVRGALNRLQTLTAAERERGILTASTGNHGLAIAYGLGKLGLEGTIYLPQTASSKKVDLLNQLGADVHFYGDDSAQTEAYAREQGDLQQKVYVSPYNDPDIVAGQGTIAIELLEQMPGLDAVFVPVGGGGLIAGIAAYLKAVRPEIRVIGCVPAQSPVMYECVQAGRIVPGTVLPTLSDGTAGGVEADAITFELCRQLVDDWVMVSEDEIRSAMKLIFDVHSLVIEGAAGVSVSGFQQFMRKGGTGIEKAAVVICGGNVDMEQFKSIINGLL